MSDDVMRILGRIEGEIVGMRADITEIRDKGCVLGHQNAQGIAVINARTLGIGGAAGAMAGGVLLAGKMIFSHLTRAGGQ